jgi:hypothetical protein
MDRHLGYGSAALRLADLGYAVFPCERGAKKPHRMLPERGGFQHASSSMMNITGWWKQDPAANIGLPTGRVNGLVVVDIDTKGTVSGMQSFLEFLDEQAGQLPRDIPSVRTPSGGWHLYFRSGPDEPIPSRTGLLAGVDVRADGGYVVAPPSRVLKHVDGRDGQPGGAVPLPYRWEYGCISCTIPVLPDWLGSFIRFAPSAPSPGTPDFYRTGDVITEEDLAAAEQKGFDRGQRNESLYRVACKSYRDYGTGPEGARSTLRRVEKIWRAGDQTGMEYHELLVIIESARRFIERQKVIERQRFDELRPWLKDL